MRPWDDVHFRMLLSGANGNLLVTPPLLETSTGPFVDGQHFLSAKSSKTIVDTIQESLEHTQRGLIIANNLHDSVTKLDMSKQVKAFLSK